MLGDDEIIEMMVVRLYREGRSPAYIAGYLDMSYDDVLNILIYNEVHKDGV